MKMIFRTFLALWLTLGPVAAQQITASPGLPSVNPTYTGTATYNGAVQSPYAAAPSYGTGADGTVTISSGTTTLTRDMHYANLTLSGTGVLKTNGYRIFISNTLDISAAGAGAITVSGGNGGNASGATFGGAGVAGVTASASDQPFPSFGTSSPGITGTTAAGGAATAFSWGTASFSIGGAPGGGGAGGAGTNAGGAGTAPTAITWVTTAQFPAPATRFWIAQSGNGSTAPMIPSSPSSATGGGAGGGDGTNTGGGGGGAGAQPGGIGIYARTIQRGSNSTAGIITAKGGNGGNGGNSSAGNTGGGGGGGASGGGFVYIVTDTLLGSTITNAIDVSGGTGGASGNGQGTGKGGNGGSGGNSGNVQKLVLGAPSFTVSTFNAAGTAGSTTVTSTGAAGGAGATLQVSL